MSELEFNIEADVAQLRRLIKRTQRGKDSLISTPLLMHWASELDGNDMAQAYNVSRLYQLVVKKHIDKGIQTRPVFAPDQSAAKELQVAMVRALL